MSGGHQNSVGRVKVPNCATTPAWFRIIFTWMIQKIVRSIASLYLGANGGAGSEGCEGEHSEATRLNWHYESKLPA